ncbi:MAG: DUF4838 domain-containing protein [Lentisphaeria bacterium]|nr:DUF4838 domain-containing protein [Lentisphaeria bacterium]
MKKKVCFALTVIAVSVLLTASGCCGLFCGKKSIEVKESQIVLSAKALPNEKAAAQQLKKHLELVTGKKVDIVPAEKAKKNIYSFYINKLPRGEEKRTFEWEEACWKVTKEGTYFYGDNRIGKRGLIFAVDEFLMKNLHIYWIEPGDEGIVYQERKTLTLEEGKGNWKPSLNFANIRGGIRKVKSFPKNYKYPDYLAPFTEFFGTPDVASHNKKADEYTSWRTHRMRMANGRKYPGYGHSFTKWWDLYSKTNPEYFALNIYGRREPETYNDPKGKKVNWTARDKQFVKICPSNPAVAERIISEWKKRRMPIRVNTSMNDMNWGYCRCENCMKLDGYKVGDFPDRCLPVVTDRYVYLANKVVKEARKYKKDAQAAMYGYNEGLFPPRFQKVDPNVIIGLVPTKLDLPTMEKLFADWRKMGGKMFALRPNFHTVTAVYVLPTGFEKQMFDLFQTAYKNGCESTDYDSLTLQRLPNGIMDYILARSFMDPSLSFEQLEDEYCSAFGAAKEEMKNYFRHWRKEVFEKRIKDNLNSILEAGKADNYMRGLVWNLGKYYKESDFITAGEYLKKAASLPNDKRSAKRIKEFQTAHDHAFVTYKAITAPDDKKIAAAKALLDFRRKYLKDLRGNDMSQIFWFEVLAGDITGIKAVHDFKDYKDAIPAPAEWHFALDAKNTGMKNKIYTLPPEKFEKWEKIPVGIFWENAPKGKVTEALYNKLKDYNGLAWYAIRLAVPANMKGKKVFLHFGAVDEACTVFVNGKKAGAHPFINKWDWKTPFTIEITANIDYSKKYQNIFVQVEDKSGVGGIWRKVWLVTK